MRARLPGSIVTVSMEYRSHPAAAVEPRVGRWARGVWHVAVMSIGFWDLKSSRIYSVTKLNGFFNSFSCLLVGA